MSVSPQSGAGGCERLIWLKYYIVLKWQITFRRILVIGDKYESKFLYLKAFWQQTRILRLQQRALPVVSHACKIVTLQQPGMACCCMYVWRRKTLEEPSLSNGLSSREIRLKSLTPNKETQCCQMWCFYTKVAILNAYGGEEIVLGGIYGIKTLTRNATVEQLRYEGKFSPIRGCVFLCAFKKL